IVIEKDINQAGEYYYKAAYWYEKGSGVTEDEQKVFKLYRKAADMDHVKGSLK
ncbi:9679_t:CDS:1, partial [Racocetra persica]